MFDDDAFPWVYISLINLEYHNILYELWFDREISPLDRYTQSVEIKVPNISKWVKKIKRMKTLFYGETEKQNENTWDEGDDD